jgi:hypothetical protein
MQTSKHLDPIRSGTITGDHWSRQCVEGTTRDGWSFICGMSGGPIDAPEYMAIGSINCNALRGVKPWPCVSTIRRA